MVRKVENKARERLSAVKVGWQQIRGVEPCWVVVVVMVAVGRGNRGCMVASAQARHHRWTECGRAIKLALNPTSSWLDEHLPLTQDMIGYFALMRDRLVKPAPGSVLVSSEVAESPTCDMRPQPGTVCGQRVRACKAQWRPAIVCNGRLWLGKGGSIEIGISG